MKDKRPGIRVPTQEALGKYIDEHHVHTEDLAEHEIIDVAKAIAKALSESGTKVTHTDVLAAWVKKGW